MNGKNYLRTKYACYITSLSTAITCNLSPILFLTFRELYGISYTLLGLLVVINFGTQLIFDLIFSFFSEKININLSTKLTSVLITVGLIVYALAPMFLPDNVYIGIVIGTVAFSTGSGLSEVLTSPCIAALPGKNKQKDMSLLHSFYAWGVVFVVTVSTLFLHFCGQQNWQYLTLILAVIPLLASVLYIGAPMPEMKSEKRGEKLKIDKTMLILVLAIFLGGASECTMSQWCSGYLEQAFGIEKIWGDLFGVALFGVMLGLGRTLYASFGKNIKKVLIIGSAGATVCYITAVVSLQPIIGLIACALTGFCVSMLWPGTLLVAAETIPDGGVSMYALLAAGGDMGASICPQIVGVITDAVLAGSFFVPLADRLGIGMEQLSLKVGMAFGALLPLLSTVVFLVIEKKIKPLPRKIAYFLE